MQRTRFQCQTCGRMFESSEELLVHDKEEHQQGLVEGYEGSVPRERPDLPREGNLPREGQEAGEFFVCRMCGREFQSREQLDEHNSTEHRTGRL